MLIDHATNFIVHCHQATLTSVASIQSKHDLKSHLRTYGIKLHRYASDNHLFTSKEWIADCSNQQQQQRSLSSVGAHHQNYMERHLQTIFNWARITLLHFVLSLAQAQENLWPFTIDYAIHLWNTIPTRDWLISPLEHIASTAFSNHHHLQQAHVFGCPVFILDPPLQDSKKISKWAMRSKRGIYLGVSPFHEEQARHLHWRQFFPFIYGPSCTQSCYQINYSTIPSLF